MKTFVQTRRICLKWHHDLAISFMTLWPWPYFIKLGAFIWSRACEIPAQENQHLNGLKVSFLYPCVSCRYMGVVKKYWKVQFGKSFSLKSNIWWGSYFISILDYGTSQNTYKDFLNYPTYPAVYISCIYSSYTTETMLCL